MNYRIKDIPKEERPRERLKEVGAESLTNKELLAIILKSVVFPKCRRTSFRNIK